MRKLITLSLLTFGAMPALACPEYSDLQILSPDTDDNVHGVITQDIWAVWYHPAVFSEAEAQTVIDRLTMVRCEAVGVLGMKDPKSAEDGYFTNVILHTTENDVVDDGFPNDWENAVGKNDNNHSQMELAEGAPDNMPLIDHEGFHIMQDQVSNRYENSEAFSFWIAEASADWFAWLNDPNMESAFENVAVIYAAPQLPFYLESDNMPWEMDLGELISNRPYSMNTLLSYAQLQTPITKQDITRGYYNGNLTPQEMMVNELGVDGFKEFYANFAAKVTASMAWYGYGDTLDDFVMTGNQREYAANVLLELLEAKEEGEDPDGVLANYDMIQPTNGVVDGSGRTTDWFSPESDFRPYPWGYNVVEFDEPNGTPTLEFEGKNMTLRLVTVIDEQWYIEPVENGDTLDFDLAEGAMLIVAYTPDKMAGFDRGEYRLRLN